jgi:hypothetical protein
MGMVSCNEPAWLCQNIGLFKDFIPGNNDVIKEIIKDVLVAIFVTGLGWLTYLLWLLLRYLFRIFVDPNAWRIERLREATKEDGPGLWLAVPITTPPDYKRQLAEQAFIMTVANAKGGVGKTTTTANLAAAFARRLKRPILAIDLDPQGSLSGIARIQFASEVPKEDQFSAATQAIEEPREPYWLIGPNQAIKSFTWRNAQGRTIDADNLFLLPAYEDLDTAETRVLIKWLMGDILTDVRFNLFRLLRSQATHIAFLNPGALR